MSRLFKVALGIPLAAVFACAQQSYEYVGDIVNGKCMQAAQIVSRNSHGYTPATGVNAFTETSHKPLDTRRLRKTILRHCAVNPGVTEFAFLNAEGNFFKLDDAGNAKALSQSIAISAKTRVKIIGSIDRETLKVQAILKQE